MHKEQRKIGEIEITIEQLNAVSGGAVMSADDVLAFKKRHDRRVLWRLRLNFVELERRLGLARGRPHCSLLNSGAHSRLPQGARGTHREALPSRPDSRHWNETGNEF
jgi:hypothetical protein